MSASVERKPALLHEWDAEPGVGVQKLGGVYRCVMWNNCARCNGFVTVHLDVKPSLVLPESAQQQITGVLRQMRAKMESLICPGAPLPLPQRNGAG